MLKGDEIAQERLNKLRGHITGKELSLSVVKVGDHKVSSSYIRKKQEAADFIGVRFDVRQFPDSISQFSLINEIRAIIESEVNACIVQLPLPTAIRSQDVLDAISVEKDADLLSSGAFGKFALGTSKILPPTVKAVSIALEKAGVQLKGTRIALVGTGRLVGLPLAVWLMREGATVLTANEYTENVTEITKSANVVISGVGKPNLINPSMVTNGVVLIDAGTSVEQGQARGDIDPRAFKKAAFYSPVPGGIGPLTVACLLENVVELAKR